MKSKATVPIVLLVVAVIGFAAWRWWPKSKPNDELPPLPAKVVRAIDQGFVGSQACAECHAEQFDGFSKHSMGNSLRGVLEARQIENYKTEGAVASGRAQYSGELRDQRIFHHEIIRDDVGRSVVDQQVGIDFTVGSGSRGRSYLINADGRLYQSPLTWYVEDAIWGMSPGYKVGQHQRFERRITSECLMCHAGRMNYIEGDVDRFDRQQPFAEMSIGCERCHGPGKQHVAFRSDGIGTDAIVNPTKLPAEQRNDACNQCHLGGKERVLKQGRNFHEYRPGEPVGDHWTVFVDGTGFNTQGKALFTSHVEQMHSSVCFQESKGRMTCYSCHDPHRLPSHEAARDYYRAKCMSCHSNDDCSLDKKQQEAAPANDSCFYCHMPRSKSSDINHVSLADHRLLRTPADIAKSNQSAAKQKPWRIFPGMEKGLSAWEKSRAIGIARYKQGLSTNDERFLAEAAQLLTSVVAENGKDDLSLLYLGLIHQARSDYAASISLLSTAVKVNPLNEAAWASLAVSCLHAKQYEKGIPAARRAIAMDPAVSMQYGLLAELLARTGDKDEAIEQLKAGLKLNPLLIPLHQQLIILLQEKGLTEEADEHREMVIRLEAMAQPK